MSKLTHSSDFCSPEKEKKVQICSDPCCACVPSAVLFGQFVVFQTLNTDVVEIFDGSLTNSGLLSSIYGAHSGNNLILHVFFHNYFQFICHSGV